LQQNVEIAGKQGSWEMVRVSRDQRVEAYGCVDELNSVLGFAPQHCTNTDICAWTEAIQKHCFDWEPHSLQRQRQR